MRPEIAEQGIVDTAQALCPGLQTGYMVNADAQNLGVQSRELACVGFVRRDLARSDGRPGQRKEHQYNILTAVVA